MYTRRQFFAALGVMALSLQCLLAQQYEVVDLGTLGGASSQAYGINQSGKVVGAAAVASGALHAFLYSNGSMTDLGTLGGGTSSIAKAINDSGVVVGVANNTSAFRWEAGPLTGIPGQSDATAINSAGQIVVNNGSCSIFFNGVAG